MLHSLLPFSGEQPFLHTKHLSFDKLLIETRQRDTVTYDMVDILYKINLKNSA